MGSTLEPPLNKGTFLLLNHHPILSTGDQLKIPAVDISVAIMLGASAGFINPFSYQTNLMVYAAGNYSVREFATIGAPFQIWLMVVASFILCYMKQWKQVWIATWSITAFIVFVPALLTLLPHTVQNRMEAFFDRIAEAINPRAALQRRRSARAQSFGGKAMSVGSTESRTDGSSTPDVALTFIEMPKMGVR